MRNILKYCFKIIYFSAYLKAEFNMNLFWPAYPVVTDSVMKADEEETREE